MGGGARGAICHGSFNLELVHACELGVLVGRYCFVQKRDVRKFLGGCFSTAKAEVDLRALEEFAVTGVHVGF